MAAEQKMSVSEALNVAVGLTNHYRAFEKIKEMLETVASLDGERNVIEKAIRDAGARKEVALREAAAAEARLVAKQEEFGRFVAPLEQRKAGEAARIERERAALQARYNEEEARLEEKFAKQSRENKEQIQALEAQRSDLQKEVQETESRLKELKARVASTVKSWQEGEVR